MKHKALISLLMASEGSLCCGPWISETARNCAKPSLLLPCKTFRAMARVGARPEVWGLIRLALRLWLLALLALVNVWLKDLGQQSENYTSKCKARTATEAPWHVNLCFLQQVYQEILNKTSIRPGI